MGVEYSPHGGMLRASSGGSVLSVRSIQVCTEPILMKMNICPRKEARTHAATRWRGSARCSSGAAPHHRIGIRPSASAAGRRRGAAGGRRGAGAARRRGGARRRAIAGLSLCRRCPQGARCGLLWPAVQRRAKRRPGRGRRDVYLWVVLYAAVLSRPDRRRLPRGPDRDRVHRRAGRHRPRADRRQPLGQHGGTGRGIRPGCTPAQPVASDSSSPSCNSAARTDGLTGLPNRRAFEEHFEREVARANRTRRPFALLSRTSTASKR